MPKVATTIPGLLQAEYFDIDSTVVGDTFRIFVAKPPFAPSGKHPAIFVTDGNVTFFMAAGIQRMLSMAAENPVAYVIGIGYPTEGGFFEAFSKRNRDLVPSDGGEYGRAMLLTPTTPGAAKFVRFIADELKPELDLHYSIDSNDSTYVGSSLGGLFGAWALLNSRNIFQRYILVSPTIAWNDEEVWQWEADYAKAHRDLSATIFVSAGSLESPEHARNNAIHLAKHSPALRPQVESITAWCDKHGWPRTTELPGEFADKLRSRSYPTLKVHHHIMPDETHLSVTPSAITRGLRYVFGQWHP
jgi:predicted alpha/beta superfamily hydrolase